MKFRFKAFGYHLLGSASLMGLVLGGLYLGWYRWPGWYLAGASTIALMMFGFDVVLGPALTFVIANPGKPRRELARDIGIIICVQIIAAGYGAATLWNGRVLYYVYSQKYLEIVQASDLDAEQIALGKKLDPEFAPHWYSLPRWIYAPLPQDENLQKQIVTGSIAGGDDVIQMPRYYKPWEVGLPQLRRELRVVDKMGEFSGQEKATLKERMKDKNLDPDQPITIPMMGRARPLLAVIDPASVRITALLRAD
jgi:hypothetical protein